MKVLAFLFVNSVFVESILFANIASVKLFLSNSDVIIEVIGNYLEKFISHKESILAIATASLGVQQKHLQDDLIQKFITSTKIINFSYKILKKVDQTRQGNNQQFNLIFIDRSGTLV